MSLVRAKVLALVGVGPSICSIMMRSCRQRAPVIVPLPEGWSVEEAPGLAGIQPVACAVLARNTTETRRSKDQLHGADRAGRTTHPANSPMPPCCRSRLGIRICSCAIFRCAPFWPCYSVSLKFIRAMASTWCGRTSKAVIGITHFGRGSALCRLPSHGVLATAYWNTAARWCNGVHDVCQGRRSSG